jgi:small nuclear ribonucleoprotein (snRNP)-like protein
MSNGMKFIASILFTFIVSTTSFSQGFIAAVSADDIGVILNNPVTIVLQNGDTLSGKLTSASLINSYLKNVTLKSADGSKRKLEAAEMKTMKVKVSEMAKMAMMNESANSIFRTTKTDFNSIVSREYIFFEQALRATKKDKPAMMQLLNPGFDHAIKVYADPNANETGGLQMEEITITGGADKSYLFVKNKEKVVIVKKGSYKKNFDELYADCPEMLKAFEGDKTKFKDIAGHVFVYDQLCNK